MQIEPSAQTTAVEPLTPAVWETPRLERLSLSLAEGNTTGATDGEAQVS